MNGKLYIESQKNPLVTLYSEKLSDGSEVWNLDFNGTIIECLSEERADGLFDEIAHQLRIATNLDIKTY